jgi:hypothetical protein
MNVLAFVTKGGSGKSTLAAATAVAAFQGGAARMTEARMQLARRFAAQSVMAEELEAALARGENVEVEQHALISSTLVRLASRLGMDRRAHKIVPDLADYVDVKANEPRPAPGTSTPPDETVP